MKANIPMDGNLPINMDISIQAKNTAMTANTCSISYPSPRGTKER